MPRVSSPSFRLRITYLEPDPDHEKEVQWVEEDLPVSVGKFRLGKNLNIKDRSKSSFLMQCSEGSNIGHFSPCLVLNKIDWLIFELKLSPMEAYTRLIRIVHEVNGIVSAYKSEKYLSDVDSILASPSGELSAESLELLEDDEEVTFQPQKGNVVFVCALDGWGFGISEFADFYAPKVGASATALQKSLWRPRYYVPKTKMIIGKKSLSAGSKAKPMFMQFVLEPLWQVYEAALDPGGDRVILEKVIKSFNLSIPPRELQSKDPKNVLQSVMSRWLPLSDAYKYLYDL